MAALGGTRGNGAQSGEGPVLQAPVREGPSGPSPPVTGESQDPLPSVLPSAGGGGDGGGLARCTSAAVNDLVDALADAVGLADDDLEFDGSLSLGDLSEDPDPAPSPPHEHGVDVEDPESRPSQMLYLHGSSGSVHLTVAESTDTQKTRLNMAATLDRGDGEGYGRDTQLWLIVVAVDLMLISNAKLVDDDEERLARVKTIISAYGLEPDDATVAEVVSLLKKVCLVACMCASSL